MNKTGHFVSINLDIKPDPKLKVQKWDFDLVVKFVELEAWGKKYFVQTNKNDLSGKLYFNKIFFIALKRVDPLYKSWDLFFL